jgi:hypothetical protein
MAVNRGAVGGQDANLRSLEWLSREKRPDIAAAARSKSRSTIRSTKKQVLYDFGGLRRSPRVYKSLKNLVRVDCHGRGRGFEPRRPRHKPKKYKGLRQSKSDSIKIHGTQRYATSKTVPNSSQQHFNLPQTRTPFVCGDCLRVEVHRGA